MSLNTARLVTLTGSGSPGSRKKNWPAGDVVGEMSIISGEPRLASVISVGDVRTLCLEHLPFESQLRERPEISLAVMWELCRR